MPQNPIRVLIADDHPVLLDGLLSQLGRVSHIHVVGTARSFTEVHEVLGQTAADVLILDVLGMGESPIATVGALHRTHPTLKIIVFSSTVSPAPELLKAGARGYLTKEEMFDDLVQAITEVSAGGTFLSRNVREYVEQTRRRKGFTDQEFLVLRLNARGMPTLDIVAYMGLSRGTIDNYFSRLYEKTGCKDKPQLAAWYREQYGEP